MNKDAQIELGKEIRNKRKERGLTQGQLAEMVGCTAAHISSIEQANKGVSFETLVKIENALGIKPGSFSDADLVHTLPKSHFQRSKVKFVPRTTNAALLKKNVPIKLEPDDAIELLPNYIPSSDQTFALLYEKSDMEPTFLQHDLVFLDPKLKPKSGDYVLFDSPKGLVLRRYTYTKGARLLDGANNAVAPAHLNVADKDLIIGVVIYLQRAFGRTLEWLPSEK